MTIGAYLYVQDSPLNLTLPGIILDTMKGSYYANPVLDEPNVSPKLREAYPEYYGNNICTAFPPSTSHRKQLLTLYAGPTSTAEVQDFEHAFKDLGRYVAIHCTSF